MSTKIGGPHRCNIHPDFPETDDQNEWNDHCAQEHTTTGVCQCIDCGCSINLDEVPYQPIGKEIKLQCPDCFNNNQDLNKLVNSQQQNQNNQGVVESQQ